jgi:hypothetical protein
MSPSTKYTGVMLSRSEASGRFTESRKADSSASPQNSSGEKGFLLGMTWIISCESFE